MIELKQHNIKPYAELCVSLSKYNKCAYISATGTGKSYVAAKYVEDYHKQDECVVVVPTIAIGDNWKALLPNIEVITYTKLCINKNNIKEALIAKSLIILDEFHHVGAEKWGKPFFDILDKFNGKIIGLSATPIRYLDSGRNMIDEFFDGSCVNGLSLSEAISSEVLPSFSYITALYELPKIVNNFKTKSSNTSTEKLINQLDVLNSKCTFKQILTKYLHDKSHFKIIIFIDMIKSLDSVKSLFDDIELDYDMYVVNSEQPKIENDRNLEGFKNNKRSAFLLCVDMLNEGIHIKETTGIIMFRKTQSPIVYLQQLGRALSSGMKETPLVFDFVANHSNLKTYVSMQKNTIHRLNLDIRDPKKQIIVSDYALEAEVLIDKIETMLDTRTWRDDELKILHDNYPCSISHIMELLPHRSYNAIVARLRIEGLSITKQRFTPEICDDIKRYYPLPNGMSILTEKYPYISQKSFSTYASRHGVRKLNSNSLWSDEEISILYENFDKTVKELMSLLPNRTEGAIHNKLAMIRKDICYSYKNNWDDEKISRFSTLYRNGEYIAVSENSEFSDLPRYKITRLAKRFNVSSLYRPYIKWSDNEIASINDYIESGDETTIIQFTREFLKQFPNHSKGAIRRKIYELRKQQKQKEDV